MGLTIVERARRLMDDRQEERVLHTLLEDGLSGKDKAAAIARLQAPLSDQKAVPSLDGSLAYEYVERLSEALAKSVQAVARRPGRMTDFSIKIRAKVLDGAMMA